MTPHRVIEFGLLVCALGASMMAIGAGFFLASPSGASGLRQRWWTLAGGVVLVIGFLVQLAGEFAR